MKQSKQDLRLVEIVSPEVGDNTMKKSFLELIGIILTLLIFSLLGTDSLYSQSESVDQRLTKLEGQMRTLEQKVNDLQRILDELLEGHAEFSPIRKREDWRNLDHWRTGLNKGMTKAQVKGLMGEPDKIDVHSMGGEVWYY